MSVQAPEIWSDLDHRFIQDGRGQLRKSINVDSVITSIDNILRTSPGERVMLPEFGCGLKSMMFEGMNKALMTFLSREIKSSIERWDDRAVVIEVQFSSNPDHNEISITISFGIIGMSQIFKYEKTFKGEV
jgi:phage baseplate assembly protein W